MKKYLYLLKEYDKIMYNIIQLGKNNLELLNKKNILKKKLKYIERNIYL